MGRKTKACKVKAMERRKGVVVGFILSQVWKDLD
jgi:hypothetical protein